MANRPCIGCGQYDDAPRHVVALPDGNEVLWHMDCHALSGDGCPQCQATVDSAAGKQNAELREHIVSGGAAEAVAAVQAQAVPRVLPQDQEG